MPRTSYLHVPHTLPMEARCLHQSLDSMAQRRPDTEALVMYDMDKTRSAMTYREYRDRSMFLASSLLDLGLSRGHRVLLIGASSIRFAVSIMALHRTGANVILLGPGGLTDDKVKLLKTLNLKMIIFEPEMKESQLEQLRRGILELTSYPGMQPVDTPILITQGDQESSHRVYNEGDVHRYESLLDRGRARELDPLLQAQEQNQLDDPHVAVFTSGSTGASKLVQCTTIKHVSSSMGSSMIADDSKAKMYFDRPMAWSAGYASVLRVTTGTPFVWVPTEMALSAETSEMVFEIMAKEKCSSALLGVGLIHKLASENLHKKYDLSSLKAILIGGQRYPLPLVESVVKCLPLAQILLGYGSSEGGICGIAGYSKQNLTTASYGKMTVVPGIEVKVVDEDDKLVPIGTDGEICVRGQGVFLEYVGNPVATKKVKTPTGWYHMGDVGRMDDKGRIEVLGRKKEFIKRATVKIFPAEIESVLLKHSAVADAVVIGVPDQLLYEEICACVILMGGESTEARLAELVAWCAQQWPPGADGLSLKPKYFVPMASFLWLRNGKIDINGLRKSAMEMLQIKEF